MKFEWPQLDSWMFNKINSVWTHPILDWLLPSITDLHLKNEFRIALALACAFFAWRKRRQAILPLLALVFSIGLADFACYRGVKIWVKRDRPAAIEEGVLLRSRTHSGFSFPSNHAANVFAAATALSALAPGGALFFFIVAALVAYSRVYVGVHYPLDVLAGALLGWFVARLVLTLFRLHSPRARLRSAGYSSREHN